MAYPGAYKNSFIVSASAAAVPPNGGSFRKIVATQQGNVLVKGHGLWQYLSANNASATSYIDPSTGVAFEASDNAAGFYEAVSTTEVSVAFTNGMVLEGEFLSVKLPASGAAGGVVAYS